MQASSAIFEISDGIPAGEAVPDRSRMLIDAANQILDEGGLEGLTIRAVLKRTGLARRAFYECFVGKDDLVLAVFEQTLRESALYFGALSAPQATPLDRIRVVVEGLVMGAIGAEGGYGERRVAAMVREHLRLAQTRPGQLQAALQPLLTFLAEQITEGVLRGQLRHCDAVLQATLIYNLVATTLHTELMTQESMTVAKKRRRAMVGDIWEFCRRAIIA